MGRCGKSQRASLEGVNPPDMALFMALQTHLNLLNYFFCPEHSHMVQ